ncbi:MAG: glycosyltransferase [Fusobacterium perfoetens]|uniref:glycosyltransferase n=1 Tax=Fusobacterium perfoetens TaxID=852 RepID=UPI0023F38805|nr:glycosyltransferase [Fusobacterium perfoetens]MCI6152858.1 glycosyltransferase [Fusobacterium perfoetens]MDY3237270.1 glycosyltransferase [Fusobacterium perfoetens]
MKELSIIVPVYNIEKYIKECLESISKIKNINYEVLIINDGSKDNSQKIINDYCKTNIRAKSYIKTNGGLSSARNYGLERAIGEYIWFVDGDDIIEPDEFESFFKEAFKEKLDIGIANFSEFYTSNKIEINRIKKYQRLVNLPILNGKKFFQISDRKGLFSVTVWKNIYRKKFLVEEKIKFKDGIIFEDELFSRLTINRAQKVKYYDSYIYFYRQNRENSIMKTINKDKLLNYYKIAELLSKEFTKDKNVPSGLKKVPISLYTKTLKKVKIRDKKIEKIIFNIPGIFFYKLRKKLQILL